MIISKTKDVKTPEVGTAESAGIDFFIPDDFWVQTLWDGQKVTIASGIRMMIPQGFMGVFLNKSSIGSKGILIGAQVIDSDYRGEIHIDLHNISDSGFKLKAGMKIAQLIIVPYMKTELTEISTSEFDKDITVRGNGGFGSTGAE